MRLQNPPFGTETSERLLMAAAAEHITEMLEALHQYVSDLRYPPEGDSIQRRIERAEAVIAKARGDA